MLKKVLFMLMFLPALSFADVPRGVKLVQRLWRDMNDRNVEKIKEYTSKEFQALNSLGVGEVSTNYALNRFQELDLIQNTIIQSYSLSDITATQGENIIVVTYFANVTETVYSQPVEGNTPRVSVWKKVDDKWKWVAQADLVISGPFVGS